MTKTLGSFKLNVEPGSFTNCEIIVLLGENGTGKTTLVRLLAGDKKCEADEKEFDVNLIPLFSFAKKLNKINIKNFC